MAGPEESLRIDTVKGTVSAKYARPRSPFATIVVAHGAGAGMDHPFLVGFSRACVDEGLATMRFNFPYIESGRRSPDTESVLRDTWRAAFEAAWGRRKKEPVWASGKSLGYPLHPPGKPERIRDEHLSRIEVPMLFLQGTSDPFASPDLLRRVVKKLGRRATLVPFEGGGHSFEIRGHKRDPHEIGASLAPHAAAFIREHI
jgi:uncharacterized protein